MDKILEEIIPYVNKDIYNLLINNLYKAIKLQIKSNLIILIFPNYDRLLRNQSELIINNEELLDFYLEKIKENEEYYKQLTQHIKETEYSNANTPPTITIDNINVDYEYLSCLTILSFIKLKDWLLKVDLKKKLLILPILLRLKMFGLVESISNFIKPCYYFLNNRVNFTNYISHTVQPNFCLVVELFVYINHNLIIECNNIQNIYHYTKQNDNNLLINNTNKDACNIVNVLRDLNNTIMSIISNLILEAHNKSEIGYFNTIIKEYFLKKESKQESPIECFLMSNMNYFLFLLFIKIHSLSTFMNNKIVIKERIESLSELAYHERRVLVVKNKNNIEITSTDNNSINSNSNSNSIVIFNYISELIFAYINQIKHSKYSIDSIVFRGCSNLDQNTDIYKNSITSCGLCFNEKDYGEKGKFNNRNVDNSSNEENDICDDSYVCWIMCSLSKEDFIILKSSIKYIYSLERNNSDALNNTNCFNDNFYSNHFNNTSIDGKYENCLLFFLKTRVINDEDLEKSYININSLESLESNNLNYEDFRVSNYNNNNNACNKENINTDLINNNESEDKDNYNGKEANISKKNKKRKKKNKTKFNNNNLITSTSTYTNLESSVNTNTTNLKNINDSEISNTITISNQANNNITNNTISNIISIFNSSKQPNQNNANISIYDTKLENNEKQESKINDIIKQIAKQNQPKGQIIISKQDSNDKSKSNIEVSKETAYKIISSNDSTDCLSSINKNDNSFSTQIDLLKSIKQENLKGRNRALEKILEQQSKIIQLSKNSNGSTNLKVEINKYKADIENMISNNETTTKEIYSNSNDGLSKHFHLYIN